MWYPHHGYGWETVIAGGLMMLLFWGGLIALGVWLLRTYVAPSATSGTAHDGTANRDRGSQRALEILQERYARGEISKAEFEQMRDDLRT